MSRDTDAAARREEELLRINAELAAELRVLRAGAVREPRSTAGPAARRVSRLIAERDWLAAERDGLNAERERLLAQIEAQRNHLQILDEQLRSYAEHNDELAHEVIRLRGGLFGLMLRAWARLSRRR